MLHMLSMEDSRIFKKLVFKVLEKKNYNLLCTFSQPLTSKRQFKTEEIMKYRLEKMSLNKNASW